MRLYAKLLVMILIAGALQHFAPPSRWAGEAWFTMRCQAAYVLGDARLSAQLVDEHHRTFRCFEDEEMLEIKTHYQVRVASAAGGLPGT